MGHRTLKRVSLDFDWPLHEVWEGYINPHPGPLRCNLCDGSGYNAATKKIADEFYDHDGNGSRCWGDKITQEEVQVLVDNDRLLKFTHIFKRDEGWKRREDGYIPTAKEVNEHEYKGGFNGHDAINRWYLVEARAKRFGVYGKCPACDGEGTIPHPKEAIRKLHEEWKMYEPPTGAGYQLWETTSNGSPISPVFASAEELAQWCAENATIFGSEKMSRDSWLKMFIEKSLETGSLLVTDEEYFRTLASALK